MRVAAFLFQVLILVHTVDNREIAVNQQAIVSITRPREQMTDDAHCLISLVDSKFITTQENCATVIRMLQVEDAKVK